MKVPASPSSPDQDWLQPIAQVVLHQAVQEAGRLFHEYVGTEHVFIALTRCRDGYTGRLLERYQWDAAQLRATLRARSFPDRPHRFLGHGVSLTPRMQAVLRLAATTVTSSAAEGLEDVRAMAGAPRPSIGEKALLVAILQSGPGVTVRLLQELLDARSAGQAGSDGAASEVAGAASAPDGGTAPDQQTGEAAAWEALVESVVQDPGPQASSLIQHGRERADVKENQPAGGLAGVGVDRGGRDAMGGILRGGDTPIVNRYGTDLTAQAREGKIREAIGRKHERDEIVLALLQQERNVPVLVGPAGVGKTAIVRGLAARLVRTDKPVPEPLQKLRLVEVRMADLEAGASVRGEFEERIQGLLRECAAHREIVLFIDEIQTLVGAGHSSSNHDAAQLFKTALATGDLRLVGSTTPAEFQRFLAADPALERRLQRIDVPELSPAETDELLRTLLPELDKSYQVEIEEKVVAAAIDLSGRYLPEQHYPDKALHLVHEACSLAVLSRGHGAVEPAAVLPGLAHKQPGLLSMNMSLEEGVADASGVPAKKIVVTPEMVAQVLGRRLNLPVATITQAEHERFQQLEQQLTRRIVAQDAAVKAVAETLKVGGSALRPTSRPKGVLLFAGPTGVGKTQMAKAVAEVLFGDERNLLILGMAELSQEHMLAELIGAPPGYVGYEQGGRLTSWLREHPYSVVLMDEIEKAHSHVRTALLGLFDEGRITDGQGHNVNGREAVYMLTTNWLPEPEGGEAVGSSSSSAGGQQEAVTYALSLSEDELRRRLGAVMTPELVGRIDRVVVFRPLGPEALTQIAQRHIDRIAEEMERTFGVTLEVDHTARDWLVQQGTSAVSGARGLEQQINRSLLGPIAEREHAGQLQQGKELWVRQVGDGLRVELRPGS